MPLRKNTLVILGAGSSKEFGFPLGPHLSAEIAQALDFDFSSYGFAGGNEVIRRYLFRLRTRDQTEFAHYRRAADHIRRNVGFSSSIDRFIDSNRDDRYVVNLSKFAIQQVIASYESKSVLHINDFEIPSFNSYDISASWLVKLFGYIHKSVSEDGKVDIFQNIRFVVFNYDRVVEQFFIIALSNFYAIPPHEARALVEQLDIIHVYGSLGPVTGPGEIIEFGKCSEDLENAVSNIQTFHESLGKDVRHRILESCCWAQRIFVLGFSFGEMNMRLFEGMSEQDGIRPVFATSYEMSPYNTDIARRKLEMAFNKNAAASHLFPVECGSFFDQIALEI